MLRRPFVWLPTLLLAGICSPAFAAAPKAPEPPPPTPGFGESIEVNVVNVEVFVTDKKGNRITGLKKDDFEIYEDRRPVKITNFFAVEGGKTVEESPDLIAPLPAATPGAPAAAAQVAPTPVEGFEDSTPEDQRLHLVVYVDNFNIRPQNRNRVFRAIREFLTRQLRPGDRVMLVSYDRSLHVRRSFTSDPLLIASALFELENLNAWGGQADNDRRDALQEIKDSEDANYAVGRARQYAEALSNDVSFSIEALKEVVAALAGLAGRKAVLYISDGIPMVAGEEMFHAIDQKFQQAGSSLLEARNYDASRRFKEIVNQANTNRVTFYTLDAAGLRAPTAISAEERDPSTSGVVDGVYFANLQAPLQMLATETGGRAILNSNDPTLQLVQVADDFRTYYSLGYTPATSGTGRYHDITVKVKRKGLSVRHREGYRDKTAEARMSDGVRSALYFDTALNPLQVTVSTDEQNRRDDGNYTVVAVVRIPIGKLVLMPEGETGRQVARVRVFVSAMDEEGRMSDVQQLPVPIAVEAKDLPSALEKHFAYSVPVIMRPGPQKLAIGVRDELASNGSFVLSYLTVGGR
ncbi:MAG: VWA domain-containing protein [Holophagales bacterium]|nr:MAG: VWA domain-containing protein [Holophagales bacterium]